jgi:hypothetical protein
MMAECIKQGHAFGWGAALQAGRLRVRFPRMSLEFITTALGVELATNINEYQKYLLGGKATGA